MWVWWLMGQPRVTEHERESLAAAGERGEIALSAISLWEVQMLHSLGRVRLDRPFDVWITKAAAPDSIRTLPLDVSVALALNALPPSFHGDPADRIIAATARAYDLPLATRDRAIRESGAVRLWST